MKSLDTHWLKALGLKLDSDLAHFVLVQVIIDLVLGQNSAPTLAIFGILLIVVAFFENIRELITKMKNIGAV